MDIAELGVAGDGCGDDRPVPGELLRSPSSSGDDLPPGDEAPFSTSGDEQFPSSSGEEDRQLADDTELLSDSS